MLVSGVFFFVFFQLSSFAVWNVRCNLNYEIIMSAETMAEIESYTIALKEGKEKPGSKLKATLPKGDLKALNTKILIDALLQTKQLHGSATKDIKLDGSDWTKKEFKLLSDISTVVKNNDSDETLIFVNGPELKRENVNWSAFQDTENTLDPICNSEFDALIMRRLLPVFIRINELETNTHAIVTIPCLGCNAKPGRQSKSIFQICLDEALKEILKNFSKKLRNIMAVFFYYLSNEEIIKEEYSFDGMDYRVRPSSEMKGPAARPADYIEYEDDRYYSQCKLYRIIESDPVARLGSGFLYNVYFLNNDKLMLQQLK